MGWKSHCKKYSNHCALMGYLISADRYNCIERDVDIHKYEIPCDFNYIDKQKYYCYAIRVHR
jgi:hypothetical protein